MTTTTPNTALTMLVKALRRLSWRIQGSDERKCFRGIGTVLVSDICDFGRLSDGMTADQLIRALNATCCPLVPIVRKHSGMVSRFIGDALQAVWSEQENGMEHGQLAFDAACEMLREFGESNSAREFGCSIRIGLGTGDMAGDFFQPIKQFQVVGKAPTFADKLLATRFVNGSAVLLTCETARLLKLPKPLRRVGTLTRETGEQLEVFAWELET